MTTRQHNLGPVFWTVVLVGLMTMAGCGKRVSPQSRNLDGNTTVIVQDVWLLDHTPRLLDVLCVYDGINPNHRYELDAALSDRANGHFFKRGWTKQIQIPQEGTTTNIQVLWQFGGFPKNTKNIYFRLSYRNRTTGQNKSVDFELPGTGHLRVRDLGSR